MRTTLVSYEWITREKALQDLNDYLNTEYSDWEEVAKYQMLTPALLDKYQHCLDWTTVVIYQPISTELINLSTFHHIDWYKVSCNSNLKYGTIEAFAEKLDWDVLSEYHRFTPEQIDKYRDFITWQKAARTQYLPESILPKSGSRTLWHRLSYKQKLSEEFIKNHKHEVVWSEISTYQKLSESFINEMQGFVYWELISKYQKLSENFILRHLDHLHYEPILLYQKISDELRNKLNSYLFTPVDITDNWLYKSTEFKKQEIINTGLYECHEDYFIAYKGIRSDRFSNYNFQYQYFPGHTYESWCDCTDSENSFGLSVWTKEKAKEYCSELVVKCKIRYEDVGRLVHNGGKIRCFKIEVLD